MTGLRQRGLSLAEVLVVGGLLLVLLGVVARTLAPGLRAWRRGNVRADLQGNALLIVHALGREVDASAADQIACWKRTWRPPGSTAPQRCDALAVGSPGAPGEGIALDPGGVAVWRTLAVYYVLPAQQELWQLELPVSGPPLAAMPASVREALDRGDVPIMPGETPRRVGRFVQSFAVDGAGPPWQLSITTAYQGMRSRLDTTLVPALAVLAPP